MGKLIPVLFLLSSVLSTRGATDSRIWEDSTGSRSSSLAVPSNGHPGFSAMPAATTGILFTNTLSENRSLTNQIYLNGSGVAAGDVDGDGWCDLYFCGLDNGNSLYRNTGNWHFEDITESAGVRCAGWDSTGAVFADLDGDRDLDLLVNTTGFGTRCFLNNGRGQFTDVTGRFGLGTPHGSTSLALADVDGDGYLDLYVANYRMDTLRDRPNTRFRIQTVDGRPVVTSVNGRPVTEKDLIGRYSISATGGIVENGEADAFYRNLSGTNFSAISFTNGAFLDEDNQVLRNPPYDWALSVMFRDLNSDGLPDIYVCNDFESPDRIWINQGGGRFRAIPRLALRHTSLFSMGVDVADINRDGLDDIVVADMLSRDPKRRLVQLGDEKNAPLPVGAISNRPQFKMNTVFLNRGDGTYAEVANLCGLAASEWSWNPAFLDVDLDGYEDLLITNGHERDAQDLDIGGQIEGMRRSGQLQGLELLQARRRFPRLATANLAFRNERNLTFREVGREWGFDTIGVSQGLALADLDRDGDLDVVINNLNEAASIFRNEATAPRIAVRLKGLPPNTQGVGARIQVLGGPVAQSQEVICGGRYLSGDDPIRVFATGSLTNRLDVEVAWRGGKTSVVKGVLPNHLYEIDEQLAQDTVVQPPPALTQLFTNVSGLIPHTHEEEPFDDFERQPLLPNRLSQLGPGVSWFDLNEDGFEDLIVGAGKGGQLAVFQNDGRGGFRPLSGAPVDRRMTRDLTSVLGWQSSAGAALVAGSSNYEDGMTNGASVRIFNVATRTVLEALPGRTSTPGPMALADIDADGDLDLFVGGRSIPGRYPEPASSIIYRNENGRFEATADAVSTFAQVGMVSGAVFSDLNDDGYPDLALACEWGSLRVFLNDHGKFRDATGALGFSRFTGWWNGITTADLDGDGKLDVIASNWGLNSKYIASEAHPRCIYHDDLDGNGTVEILEALFDPASKKEVAERDWGTVAGAIPGIRDRFKSYAAYAAAGVSEILGDRFKSARVVRANTLSSMMFLNRGDHFDPVVLPIEAQMSPAFAVVANDFDGDGNEDVFLSQNFFATQPATARNDAGRALLLKGDGQGGLKAVPGQESGVLVYGEQRGAASADYDHDGRVDLVVTQNGAATTLFHNTGATPGLRVWLNAGPENPDGVGAKLRLMYGPRSGAAREVHSGSGYWSQDASVQVMGTREVPAQVWVRWPGGKTTTSPVPAGAREIKLSIDGSLKIVR